MDMNPNTNRDLELIKYEIDSMKHEIEYIQRSLKRHKNAILRIMTFYVVGITLAVLALGIRMIG